MEDRLSVNPYAPTHEVDPSGAAGNPALSKLEIVIKIVFAIALSGALVGLLLSAWYFVTEISTQSMYSIPEMIATAMIFAGIICVSGLAVFGLIAAAIVPLLLIFFGNRAFFGGDRWRRHSLLNFVRVSAFLSGFIPLVLLSEWDPIRAFYGFFSGAFIAFVCPLMLGGLLRKADEPGFHV